MQEKSQLTVKKKLGYGAGELGATLFWSALGIFLLNFLTDEVGLSAALVGTALMIGKVWDAVTDPTVGYLSDRTVTKWGKRRPWFFFGAIPLGFSFFFMYTNPVVLGISNLFVWATLAYMLLCTAFTIVNIPYIAMVPELTKDFDERTNINGYRSVFSILGLLIGGGAALPLINMFESKTTGYMAMGAIFGVMMCISALIPFFSIKEPPYTREKKPFDIFGSYGDAVKNKSFLMVLIPFALNTTGFTIITASLIYYFKYIHNNEALLTPALIILFVTAMAFLPLSVKISSKLGKRNTYMYGMYLLMVSLLLLFFIGHLFTIGVVYAIMFLCGIGLSTHFVMPWSMLPDTVEYDYAMTGVRKDGMYYGIWTFMSKIGSALAIFLSGIFLETFGYVANVVQTETAILGIRFLVGPLAALFIIAANIILLFYKLDRNTYTEIQEKIKARAS